MPSDSAKVPAEPECTPPPSKRPRLNNRKNHQLAKGVTTPAIYGYSGVSRSSNGKTGSKNGLCKSAALKNKKASENGLFTSTSSSVLGASPPKPSNTSPSLPTFASGKHRLIEMARPNTICYGMLVRLPVEHESDELLEVHSIEPANLRGRCVFLHDPSRHIGHVKKRTAHIVGKLAETEETFLQFEIRRRRSEQERLLRGQRTLRKLALELSVVIYGPIENSDSVGEFLLKCGYYLQDPQRCHLQVPYRNPQSLWAQDDGEIRMTKDTTLVSEQDIFEAPPDLLHYLEYEDELPEADTPHALKSELCHHQKQALHFMLTRERGWSLQGQLDDLWRARKDSTGDLRYVNTVTEAETSIPPPDFKGGILADQMGLGKTLSIIALIAHDNGEAKPSMESNSMGAVKTTLIVVRASLIYVWNNQLNEHVQSGKLRWRLHHGKERLKSPADLNSIDIVLTTYQTLVNDYKKHQKESRLTYQVEWHRIALDEAHDIRDHSRLTAQAMRDLNAVSRWAVTGTPIQNNLSDIASLYQFLRIDPYTNGTDIFKKEVKRLCDQKTADALSKARRLIRCIMLRRSIRTVELPEREELLFRLNFSSEEAIFYNQAKTRTGSLVNDAMNSTGEDVSTLHILPWINSLRMICNLGTRAKLPQTLVHPTEGTWNFGTAQEMFNTLITTGAAICNVCRTDLGAVATEVADHVSDTPIGSHLASCSYLACGPCIENQKEYTHHCAHSPSHAMVPVSTLSSSLSIEDDPVFVSAAVPTKVKALLQDLDQHVRDEKCVVFSFWTSTLDIVEQEIIKRSIGYMRFDGKVSTHRRGDLLDNFKQDDDVRVALLSISCGAVGLDLTSASRAYLMEPHWNPSVEQQALARIYRMGQTRKVTTVRYIMRDSYEDYVINVQNRKHNLAEMLLSSGNEDISQTHVDRLKHFRSLILGG